MQANRRHMVTQDRKEGGRRKRQRFLGKLFRSGGEENERRMANNVMRGRRVCDGYLVCIDLCIDLLDNDARNGLLTGDQILT